MGKTFFFSDPHYGHANMCFGVSTWDDKSGCRKFNTLNKMNDEIVYAINSKVGVDDELYCLGDWSFGGIKNAFEFRKRLNVKTIHLILGNHDNHIAKNKLFDGIHAQELFTSVSNFKEISIDKQHIVLSHFPLEQWNNMEGGYWHLHGHCHGELKKSKYKRIDVGLDANNFNVLSFNEIKDIMSCRKNKLHHETKFKKLIFSFFRGLFYGK